MQPVTDKELIERLKEKRQKPDNISVGAIKDEGTIERLKRKRAELVRKTPVDTSDDKPLESSVESGSIIGDSLRTIASIGSSVIAEPLSGLYGLATLAGTGGDFEKASQSVASARESLTYTPETEGAKKNIKTVGDFLAPVGEALESVSSGAGDTVYEWTGSPELAAVAYSLPTAALEAVGLKGVGRVKKLSDADLIKAQKAALVDPELKYSGSVATVKLNNKGQLVDDKMGIRLVDGGIRENDVAVITNSSSATKKQMREMAKIFENGKGNDVLAMSQRTTKPIGNSVSMRLQSLASKRRGLGKRLQNIVEGDLGNTQVDISNSLGSIISELNKEGVKPVFNAKGGITLPDNWQKGTAFDLKTMSGAKRAIEDVFKLMDSKTTAGKTTLKKAHNIKQNLDEMIDASKLSESGVPATTIRKIAATRKQLNDVLSQVPEYAAVNKDLSDIKQVMAPFESFLKPGQSWADAKVSSVVGEAMKKLSTDTAFSVSLVEDLSAIEKYLRQSGMGFGDDPRALIQFRQTLTENFNVDPSIPESYIGQAAGSLATSAALGNTFGAGHDAVRLIRAGVRKRAANKLAEQNKKNFNMIKAAISQ